MSSSRKMETTPWTMVENKRFEMALALYEENHPDRWKTVARAVGNGKSVDEVKHHYQKLIDDIDLIDAADEPFYSYPAATSNNIVCNHSGTDRPARKDLDPIPKASVKNS